MELRFIPAAFLLSATAGLSMAASTTAPKGPDGHWPQWRGPLHTGEAPRGNPPLEWSEDKNVRWKVEVPGRGQSSPVVWNDLVFVTTAVPVGQAEPSVAAAPAEPAPAPATPAAASLPAPAAAAPGAAAPAGGPGGGRPGRPPVAKPDRNVEFVVQAHNRSDGKIRWRKVVKELLPHEGTHQDGSYASGSALTDGETLYAFFGSRGLYALDLNGKVLWEKQLGTMQTRNAFGEGSSPVLHGNTLVVTWDHEGQDFVVALDKKTGKELWRAERDEPTSWATPIVVTSGGKPQVIVNATNRVKSYDLATGKVLWEAGGMTTNVIPSPVSAGGMVYLMSGFRGSALIAVRLADAQGDITGKPAIAWSYDKDTPYVPSPLLYKDGLYFLKSNSAVLTRIDVATGKPSYTQRLEGMTNVYASPVAVAGRVYVVGRDGATAVLEAGPEAKVLATNTLGDGFDASPALADDEMYLRGQKYLYRISKD
jgi:outer membrane protein assembly factor BamB